ncbi:MAG TPA: alpha/beta hydrolase [Acidimicrobiales bacterium]|jgi:acetyl esterase/lipase
MHIGSSARPVHRRAGAAVVGLVLALVLSGCYPTSVDPPAGTGHRYSSEAFSAFTVTSDLTYGSAPDGNGDPIALKLDLYQPTGDKAAARPVFIWAHGGSFCCGDKADGIPPIIGADFAKRGYVVLAINYRLLATSDCGGGVTDDCYNAAIDAIHDDQAAVRWARANAKTYHLDPNRIAAGGESAGAIMATGVGLMADQPGTSGNAGHSSRVEAWVSLSGGTPGGAFVDKTDSPGYLFSGTADTTVPYAWSQQTAESMVNFGVPVVFHTFTGAGHVPWQYASTIVDQTSNFLYKELKLATAAQ